jgi:hypothetical protein
MTMKNVVFWDVAHEPTLLQNVGSCKIYTAPHLRRRHSSCIREVFDSNLCKDADCPDWGLSWFSSIPTGNSGLVPWNRLWTFPSISFLIHHSYSYQQQAGLAATFEICTRDLLRSNLGLDTGYLFEVDSSSGILQFDVMLCIYWQRLKYIPAPK